MVNNSQTKQSIMWVYYDYFFYSANVELKCILKTKKKIKIRNSRNKDSL